MTKGWGICWPANDVAMVRRLGTKVLDLWHSSTSI